MTEPIHVQMARRRRARGMTQADVAEVCHVARATVAMWELGVRWPAANSLDAWARALGLAILLIPAGEP